MDVREKLGIKIESPFWDEAYEKALMETEIPEWLTKEYIEKLRDEYGVLRKNHEIILEALGFVVKNEDLTLLAKTLYHIIATGKKSKEAFPVLELPTAPEGEKDSLGYDFVGLYPILAHIEPSFKILEGRGVEKQVASDSLVTPDHLVTYTMERIGRLGLGNSEFMCYDVSIYVNYLKVGRLRFEIEENARVNIRAFKNTDGKIVMLMDGENMHKSGNVLGSYKCLDDEEAFFADITETDEYYEGYPVDEVTKLCKKEKIKLCKNEWKCVLSKNDSVLRVHIPYGDRIDKALCEDSYNRAKEIFGRCYPEYTFKNFVLCCWMLSPVLCEILPETSNIVTFQSKYNVFPLKSMALDGFMYVYNFRGESVDELDLDKLPETNSIMRGLKNKAFEGKYVYECGGFFEI